MRLATLIVAVLALLHPSPATATQDVPEDTAESGSPLNADASDIILVSFDESWKQAHSTLARWIPTPITTWSVDNKAFIDNYLAVFSRGKKPMIFALKSTSDKPLKQDILDVTWLTCPAWRIVQNKPAIIAPAHNTRLARHGLHCQSGDFTGNQTFIQSLLYPKESLSDPNPGSRSTLGNLTPLKRYNVQALGGRELTAACVKMMSNKGTEDTCEDPYITPIFTLLNLKNVTVKRFEAFNKSELVSEGLEYADITLCPVALDYFMTLLFDFPLTRIAHDTFYSRVDPHRVVSLLEVAGECWKLVAATISLLVLVVFVSVVFGDKNGSVSRHISDIALFLLAAVLATSAVEPRVVDRVGIVRKALLGLWLAALLPLSVYFRTELTAIVTLRRPAYRIDTLPKLEDALGRRQVAPCVVMHTLGHLELALDNTSLPLQSLSKKLQSEFARYGEGELVTSNVSDCIQCASRPDRVCYAGHWRRPSSSLMKHKNVASFVEHVKTKLVTFIMPKFEWFYWPLRSLFLAIEEHKLIDWDSREPEHDNAETEFDVSGLLMLLVISYATSCLVLVIEVAVARFMRRA